MITGPVVLLANCNNFWMNGPGMWEEIVNIHIDIETGRKMGNYSKIRLVGWGGGGGGGGGGEWSGRRCQYVY